MNEWVLNIITDYWDHLSNAIYLNARKLENSSDKERKASIVSLKQAVLQHGGSLNEEDLLLSAFCMIEDIYKTVTSTLSYDQALLDYLSASAGTFCDLLRQRGYIIHYIVDNTFESDDLHMQGPIKYFPNIFRSAGFVYICPQQIARTLMDEDHIGSEKYFEELHRYIAEARDVSSMVVEEYDEAKAHFIFLDTDSEEGSFDLVLNDNYTPGVMTIFRNEAPTPGSTAAVNFPREPLG